jgi:hypothetical protein
MAVIFVSGVVTGAVSTGLYAKHSVEHMLTGGPPAARGFIVKRLVRELHLSDSQREQVEKVVCRAQAELMKIRQEQRPRVESVINGSIAEIKEHLSPDQHTKLDAMYEKARHRWFGPARGGKSPPPDCG